MREKFPFDIDDQENTKGLKKLEAQNPPLYDYIKLMTDSTLSKEEFFDMAEFVNGLKADLPQEGMYQSVHFRVGGGSRDLIVKNWENGRITVNVRASE